MLRRTLNVVLVLAVALAAAFAASEPRSSQIPQDGRAMVGDHSTIIISLKTARGPASHCSNAALASMYFTDTGSIRAYYAENSYGLITLSGIVTGPHVVGLETGWSPTSVANEADAAAAAAGVNLSLYAHKVYIVPKEADPNPIQSGWGGTSNGTATSMDPRLLVLFAACRGAPIRPQHRAEPRLHSRGRVWRLLESHGVHGLTLRAIHRRGTTRPITTPRERSPRGGFRPVLSRP